MRTVNLEARINDCGDADVCIYAGKRVDKGGNDLKDHPRDATDTAHGWVGKLVKGGGREIEVTISTRLAPVCEGDGDGLALDWIL